MLIRMVVAALAFAAVFHTPAYAQDAEREARLAVAREIIESSGSLDTMRQMFVEMRPGMIAQIQQQGTPEPRARRYVELFMEEVEVEMPRIVELGAIAYADAFTLPQLQAIRDFYASDAGQAMRRNAPELAGAMARAGMILGEDVGRRTIARMEQESTRRPDGS